jgi:indolepyruvate ferredoxin oxidoreductase
VFSHIRIANTPDDIHAIRVAAGGADLVLGGDIVVVGSKKVLSAIKPGNTHMIVNTAEFMPGDFARNADFSLPTEKLRRAVTGTAGPERSHFIDATRLATALLGNSIGANMFMLGYAYQNGGLPLSAEAVEKAIEMNGEAVAMNLAAFRYGRRAAVDPAAVESLIAPRPAEENDSLKLSQSFDETVERRVAFLTAYQSARYARRYRASVDKVVAVEAGKAPGQSALSEAVARYLFKLMAYKDEYEVARLYTDTSFIERVKSTFAAGDLRFEFHLAPPLLAKVDKATGEPKKMSFGPWMLKAFAVLAKFKFLRGTPLDVFGYTEERRMERRLVTEYHTMLETIMADLTPLNHATAVALASVPEKIRGFGPIKQRTLAVAKAEEKALFEQFRAGATPFLKAAE